MSITLPKTRNDLVVSLQPAQDENFYVIKVPEAGRFFRFGEVEYFIIQQLNGEQSFSTICSKVEGKFQSPLSEQALATFVASLQKRGLLQEQDPNKRAQRQVQRKIKGSSLYLRYSLFDPDGFLTFLDQRLPFLFTRLFFYTSLGFVFTALSLLANNYTEVQLDIANHLALENLLALAAVVLFTAVFHELAHGLACKHFGGQVHEIGFLLIYFMPAFFCNISDAWLFEQKSKRLWVAFAGGYFELLLWSAAIVAWRVFSPETSIHYLSMIVIGSSGVRILLNFNPLLKLDGYYMLSDYLEIPNLRAKALEYFRHRIKTLFRFAKPVEVKLSRRQKFIFLLYGLFAGIFSIYILGYLASLVAAYLVDQLQGTGFVIFLGIIMFAFHKKLKRIGTGLRDRFTGPGMNTSKWRKYAFLLLLVVVISLLKVELTVSGEFEIYPAHNADIRAEVEAIIDKIYVEEGERVQKGARLAYLSDREYRMQLHKIEAEIREHEAKLKMLTSGATKEEIASARSRVATAETRYKHALKTDQEAEQIHVRHLTKVEGAIKKAWEQLSFAEKKLQRVESLSAKHLVPQVTLDQVQEEVSVKRNDLREAEAELNMVQAYRHADVAKELAVSREEVEQAQADLRKLLAGHRAEEIESLEAVINALEVQQAYLEDNLKKAEIISPIDGVVTTPKVNEKIGQLVEKGDLIMEVYQLDVAKVEALIPEKEIGDIRVGQAVTLKARAYPDRLFAGTVAAIAPTAMDDDSGLTRKVLRVTTEIENSSLLLKPKMTGFAKIDCGRRTIFELLTRRLVRYFRVEFWAWW